MAGQAWTNEKKQYIVFSVKNILWFVVIGQPEAMAVDQSMPATAAPGHVAAYCKVLYKN